MLILNHPSTSSYKSAHILILQAQQSPEGDTDWVPWETDSETDISIEGDQRLPPQNVPFGALIFF